MDVTVQKENFTRQLIEEMGPLTKEHWAEVELYEDIEMDVDWPQYIALQDMNMIHFYTLRVAGQLAGYIGYMVMNSAHYKKHKYALCDLIYVSPKVRGRFMAARLMRFAEKELIEMGVINIGQGVKIHHNYGKILERQGYHLEEYYYSKRIQ